MTLELPDPGFYDGLSYLVVPVSELIWAYFDQLVSSHPDLLKTSVGEDDAVIKWYGPEPDFIQLMTGASGPYNHQEIHQIVDDIYWFKHYSESHHPAKVLPLVPI